MLRVVKYINWLRFHILSSFSSSKQISRRSVNWSITIPYSKRIQYIPRGHIVLFGNHINAIIRIEPPGCHQAVTMLILHERKYVIMSATIFQTILVVRKNINKIIPTMIPPWHGPLPRAARVIFGVFTASTVTTFKVSTGIDYETGIADPISHRLSGHTNHFSDSGYSCRGKFNIF